MQGDSIVSEQEFALKKKMFTQLHFLKQLNPAKHPVKRMAKPATECGFQYMIKNLLLSSTTVVFQQGFSIAEIEALYQASEAYRNGQTPCRLGDYLAQKCSFRFQGESARELHYRMTCSAFNFYRETGKTIAPQYKAMIMGALLKQYGLDADVIQYMGLISLPAMVTLW
jgi:hypothetical protein